jgi:hypothetical protein
MNAPTSIGTGAPVQEDNIASALAAAQMEMGKALKTANNPHFKAKYADLASVMDAAMPALNKHGIAVIQPMGEDDMGRFVETVLLHSTSGEKLTCRVPLIVAKNDMQGFGSAVTYARRYGLMAMAGIAPEDDDGNAAAKAPPRNDAKATKVEQPKPEAISQAEIDDTIAYLKTVQTLDGLKAGWGLLNEELRQVPAVIKAKDARKAELQARPSDSVDADQIPY